jgi:hypothetical protein
MLKYICAKIYICHNVLKIENAFIKKLKWFLIFIKLIIFTKHCDSMWLE